MVVKCIFSLDGNDWQRIPFEMSRRVGKQLEGFIKDNMKLNEKVEFKKAVGTFYDFRGDAIGEIEVDDE